MGLKLYCVSMVDINKRMFTSKVPQIEEVLRSEFYWGKNPEHAIKQAFPNDGFPVEVFHEGGTLHSVLSEPTVSEPTGKHLGYCRVEVIAITPSQKKRMKVEGRL